MWRVTIRPHQPIETASNHVTNYIVRETIVLYCWIHNSYNRPLLHLLANFTENQKNTSDRTCGSSPHSLLPKNMVIPPLYPQTGEKASAFPPPARGGESHIKRAWMLFGRFNGQKCHFCTFRDVQLQNVHSENFLWYLPGYWAKKWQETVCCFRIDTS